MKLILRPLPLLGLWVSLMLLSSCSTGDNADLYAGCESQDECGLSADECFTVAWGEGRGGMCSRYCDAHEDCPGFASCYELVGDPRMYRVCYARCVDDRDCAPGFSCLDAEMDERIVDAICLPR